MQVRGAPLIGATAAYGLWLALRADASDEALERAYATLLATRPTAINLKWALDEMMAAVRNRPRGERARRRASARSEIADEDVAINQAIGRPRPQADRRDRRDAKEGERVNVLTHCNAGWLATVDWGTATAPIYMAHDKGHRRARVRRRDAAAQSGRFAHRLGTRPSRRAAHGDPRQYRRPSDAARHGRHGDRRHRPRHRAGRRLQQDRHLSEGAGRPRQ